MAFVTQPESLEPRITSILRESGGIEGAMRGLSSIDIRPVASAVVIGIGGSGIQVASRVRSAVRANRIDQHALDAVSFLGIDSVSETGQNPPLPPGVDLGPDFMNLQGFNPSSFLAAQKPNDRFLQSWWDDEYRVPPGSMMDGLKRERMLGRLCFHQHGSDIRDRISAAISKAAQLRTEFIDQGNPGQNANEIPVYVVSSCAGGTGSSGFLEVITAIHSASKALGGIVPKIRAFILLPSVFQSEVIKGVGGSDAAEAQRANAYGFFRELDHFLIKGSELPAKMGMQKSLAIQDDELIHQVYLFDAKVGGSGFLGVPDMYEVVAEAIFQFIFTRMGRALIGTDGTNTERLLTLQDDFHKPRRYCSLGIARLLFPGDTFRTHLTMWWCDWVTRAGFLKEPSSADLEALPDSEHVSRLFDTVSTIVNKSVTSRFDDSVRTFLNMGQDAVQSLKNRHEVAYAEEIFSFLQRDSGAVGTNVRATLERIRNRTVDELQSAIEQAAFDDGSSVPRAREVVRHIEKQLRAQLARAKDDLNTQIAAKDGGIDIVQARLDELENAERRNIFEAAGAAIVAIFSDEVRTTTEVAESVGNAIKDWTHAVVASETAIAKHEFLVLACRRIEQLRIELEICQSRLNALAKKARDLWQQDELLGKDAGPKATSVVVPVDSQPEFDLSKLSVALRQSIAEEHAKNIESESLREFLARWRLEGHNRGFFDFGSEDRLTSFRAETSLLASLERDASEFALTTTNRQGERVPRLPEDLPAAARQVGEETRIALALRGLEQVSNNVCYSFEPGRFHLPQFDDDQRKDGDFPSVTTAVSCHATMKVEISQAFGTDRVVDLPDPERAVALSCHWGIPIHCLPVVDEWKLAYDRAARRRSVQRERGESIEPPNHIDRRFESEDECSLLLPEYFKAPQAAPLLIKGLLIAACLVDEATKSDVALCFVVDATLPPISPVHLQRGKGFVGRIVIENGGRLVPTPEATTKTLGADWYSAMKSIGDDTKLGNSIQLVWSKIIVACDPADLKRLAVALLETKIEPGLNKRTSTAQSRETFGHLKNAAVDIADSLNDLV